MPDVVYPINTMVATRGGKDDMRTCFGIGEPNDPQFTLQAAHEHAVCYAIDGNVADRDAKQNGMGISENVSPVLNTQDKHAVCYPAVARSLCARHDSSPCFGGQNIVCFAPDQNHCGTYSETDISATLNTRYHYGSGGDGALAVYDARGHGDGKIVPTITGDHENRITDYTALALARSQSFYSFSIDETAGTIKARDHKQSTTDIVIERKPQRKYIVRRLTPTECARLQGFPDWWCDGADGSDSAQYKMWGNGIALPCAADVIGRIAEEMRKDG